jgi:hypothetical protein
MISIKQWLNESPGAAAIEAEEEAKRVASPAAPFDPRTEVSADARFIVRQLTWNLVLWFLVVPLLLGFILWAAVSHH